MSSYYPVEIVTTGDAPLAIDPLASAPPFEIVSMTAPDHGKIELRDDRSLVYRPFANRTGEDVVLYRLFSDAGGAVTGSIRVILQAADRAPEMADIVAMTPVGMPVTIDGLSGAVDPEGMPLRLLATTGPSHGRVAFPDATTLTYAPYPAFAGSDSLSLVIADAAGNSRACRVSVDVRLGEPFSDGTFFTDGTGWLPLSQAT